MNLRIRGGYLLNGISVAAFLTLMGSSTFLILGPVSLAPYPLVTGMAATLALLISNTVISIETRSCTGIGENPKG